MLENITIDGLEVIEVIEVSEVIEVIEVQSGSYLGEDYIVRFSDLYGRHFQQKPVDNL